MSRKEVFQVPQLSRRTYCRPLVGIRPFRRTGIRLERENVGNKTVIHNYGHGGAGISLSPATAIEASLFIRNSQAKEDIAVLGCGIVGLLSALQIAKKGHKTTIYAKRIPLPNEKNPEVMCTSEVAPGYWNPYHYKFSDWELHNKRSLISYQQFQKWSKVSQAVLQVNTYQSMSKSDLEKNLPEYLSKNIEEVSVQFGQKKYTLSKFQTFQIHLQKFLQQVMQKCRQAGVKFQIKEFETIESVLRLQEKVVVNCMALGSKYVFGDQEVYGVKGTLLEFENPLKTSGIVGVPFEGKQLKLYIFKDKILVGLTTQQGQSMKVDKKIQEMQLSRSYRFYQECYPSAKL